MTAPGEYRTPTVVGNGGGTGGGGYRIDGIALTTGRCTPGTTAVPGPEVLGTATGFCNGRAGVRGAGTTATALPIVGHPTGRSTPGQYRTATIANLYGGCRRCGRCRRIYGDIEVHIISGVIIVRHIGYYYVRCAIVKGHIGRIGSGGRNIVIVKRAPVDIGNVIGGPCYGIGGQMPGGDRSGPRDTVLCIGVS